MKTLAFFIGTLALLTSSASGQNRRRATDRPEPPRGSVILYRNPSFIASSVEELVEKADLIVEGVVESVKPTRLANPLDPSSQWTDSVISLRRAFKGTMTERVLVAQPGGKWGDLEIIPKDDPLMRPGERYILFLQQDRTLPLQAAMGSPTFVLTGAWSGKFSVADDRISPNPRTPQGIQSHKGESVATFVSRIETLAAKAAGR